MALPKPKIIKPLIVDGNFFKTNNITNSTSFNCVLGSIFSGGYWKAYDWKFQTIKQFIEMGVSKKFKILPKHVGYAELFTKNITDAVVDDAIGYFADLKDSELLKKNRRKSCTSY